MKNLSVCLLALALGSFSAFAQSANSGKLIGIITDSTTRKAVPYATVAVINSEKKIQTGGTSDEKGAFVLDNIPVGTYQILISFVGYRTKTVANVLITAGTPGREKPAIDLGLIVVAPDSKNLKEVVVTGQRPLVEDKGDKLVYNAEIDATNTGGTAVDVFRKVPMLTVDLDGNVKMRGSSNIKVLVNGKPSSIMARNLADALKQMPANIIKSVEVITSPGAKYDAEGSAGVINIITKKQLQGTNGTVNLTAGDFNSSVGGNLNIKRGKIGLATSANLYTYRNVHENETSRTTLVNGQPVNTLIQRSKADNTGPGGYGELSLDYDPDSLNRLNFSANLWGGNNPNNSTLSNRLTMPTGQVLEDFRRDIAFRNPYGNAEFSLGWTRSFRKPDKEFSVLGQYSFMPDNYYYTINQFQGTSERPSYLEQSTNLSRNNEFTFQTDFVNPYKLRDSANLKLEFGVKTIQRFIGSEFTTDLSSTGQETDYVGDPARSNEFTYSQRVFAGYSSFRFDNRKKWAITAGVRYEHTLIDGDFITTQTRFNSRYGNLIPSLTISKIVHKKHTVKVAYTQRISRPQIWYLNPFKNYSDSKNVQTGNPFLRPELTHATELSYSTFNDKGFSLNTALFWRQTNNSMEWLATVDVDGVALTTPKNIGRNAGYGVNLNVSAQPNKKMNVSINTELTYISLTSAALQQSNAGWVFGIGSDISYKLPKNWTLQVNGYANTGWVGLQFTQTGWYYYGLAAKKEFWDKKATLTLNVNNPFNRFVRITGESIAPTFTSAYRGAYVNRAVRLTFSYRFGQMSAGGKQSKKISNTDGKGGGSR